MMIEWQRIPPGVIVRGADGYGWRVLEIEASPAGMKVEIERIDGERTLHVTMPKTKLADVMSVPAEHQGVHLGEADPEFARALSLLQASLGPLSTVECPWCLYQDNEAACGCMTHCGSVRCVNFRDPLSLTDLGVEV